MKTITTGIGSGNLIESAAAMAAVISVFMINSSLILYIGTMILMTMLHPLSHYLAGKLTGINFTHYYLNGPARAESAEKESFEQIIFTQCLTLS